jgi:hypothetical protein
MNDAARLIPEIGFNIFYLLFIWILVIKMYRSPGPSDASDRRLANLLRLGFLLLAIGDTGHVGFRVLAYAMGSLDSTVLLLGVNIPLVGAGALSTAILVTVLYMIFVEAERLRSGRSRGILYYFLLSMGIVRFILMAMPGNQWGNSVPPADWSLYRNIPLTVLGVGIGLVMLSNGLRASDRFLTYLAILIFISFLFYLPVILFVQKIPLIGMLMIPKTIAYLLMAIAINRQFFKKAAV